jgi:hypothetical protein
MGPLPQASRRVATGWGPGLVGNRVGLTWDSSALGLMVDPTNIQTDVSEPAFS